MTNTTEELVRMKQEIIRLAQYINTAKREIFAIGTDTKPEEALSDASLHLDAVIKATEEASNSIMDAADAIQAAVSGVGGEKEQAIMDATTRIYEACNFQDISGQRLTKVIGLLNHVQERVNTLITLFSGGQQQAAGKPKDAPLTDEDLLNGPQLPAQGTSQSDIDALFSSGN
jgi:chemotaxis protein CheZ